MTSRVAIVQCKTYARGEVRASVDRAMELLGGMKEYIRKGEGILLKPNLLAPDPPEKCTTTHPEIFRAVAEQALEAGALVRYGDSPAVGSTSFTAKRAGLFTQGRELGIEIVDFSDGEEVHYEEGISQKRFTLARPVREADGIISIPKMKTHGLERFTGCVKNQFGCIPGVLKGEYHVKIPDAHNFARMLLDLNNLAGPRLYVMDGVMAMEGNGPRGGDVREMGVILISTDPVALDATVCRMIDMNPEHVPTIRYAEDFGAGKWRENDIDIVGDELSRFTEPSFNIKRKPVRAYGRSGFLSFINNALVPKPVINRERCTACGICVKSCPVEPKALSWDKGDTKKSPVYDYDRCIRCYCCQELCPESAIDLKTPTLRRFLNLFG